MHKDVEKSAALPHGIETLADYAGYLSRFFAVVAPFERQLGFFDNWAATGINLDARRRRPALEADLRALHIDPDSLTLLDMPDPASFAAALGALYVLEGSTLGGKFILRAVEARLGAAVTAATAFFTGHGENSGTMWVSFKNALDVFGWSAPDQQDQVIGGALQSFRCFAKALAVEDHA